LNNLIADQELRETLSSRARARALQFSPQRMGQGYLAAYRRCAQGDLPQTSEQRPSIAEEVAA
jgi:hypothetical protein